MIRTWRRIKRNPRLVTLVPCVAAALTADQGQQTYEDLLANAKLIEHLASDAVRVPRQEGADAPYPRSPVPGLRLQTRPERSHGGPLGSVNSERVSSLMLAPPKPNRRVAWERLDGGCFDKHELCELSSAGSLEGSRGAKCGPPAQND
jgi:hypothetical protein